MNKKNNKYTKLANNTIIFTIGSFATKAFSFLIVPLYTYVLSREEYGRIDIFFALSSLITSFLSLQINQGMMRYLLGKETKDEIALSNSTLIFILGSIISIIIFPLYYLFFKDISISVLFALNLILTLFNIIFSDYLLIVGNSKKYALKGVVTTVVLLVSNVVMLVYMKLGVKGYLYSQIISEICGSLFILLSREYRNKIRISNVDVSILKEMINYCKPLIPNSLMWWIMSSGDKFIINRYLGYDANGLYSLAVKAPTIISTFYSFFIQAWSISAIEENLSDERIEFYENIYKITNAFLFIVVCVMTLFVKPLYTTIMGAEYKPAWIYVPILSLATAFSCQTGFFSVFYIVVKKTKSVFLTTVAGAVINFFASLFFVRFAGLHGITIGTLAGYSTVLFSRMIGSSRDIHIDLDIKRSSIALTIVLIQIIVTMVCKDATIYVFGVLSLLCMLYLFRKEIIEIVRQILLKADSLFVKKRNIVKGMENQ